MMVQVIIPTRNRKHFLRMALASVRAQTALTQIKNIIVSENGGCRESESVCQEFSDLPIRYLFQEKLLNGLEHGQKIIGLSEAPYTAILHDDDVWTPDHLEIALRELEGRKECSAYYANYLEAYDGHPPFMPDSSWNVWMAAGGNFQEPVKHLSFVQALTANLLSTCFHYSSLVAKSQDLKLAFDALVQSGNLYDNDRMAPMLLGEKGGLLYSTLPQVVVRIHGEQESLDKKVVARGSYVLMAETTRWILSRWPNDCRQAAMSFNGMVDQMDPKQWKRISSVGEPLLKVLTKEAGFHLWRPKVSPKLVYAMKLIIPPIFHAGLGKMRLALAGRSLSLPAPTPLVEGEGQKPLSSDAHPQENSHTV